VQMMHIQIEMPMENECQLLFVSVSESHNLKTNLRCVNAQRESAENKPLNGKPSSLARWNHNSAA